MTVMSELLPAWVLLMTCLWPREYQQSWPPIIWPPMWNFWKWFKLLHSILKSHEKNKASPPSPPTDPVTWPHFCISPGFSHLQMMSSPPIINGSPFNSHSTYSSVYIYNFPLFFFSSLIAKGLPTFQRYITNPGMAEMTFEYFSLWAIQTGFLWPTQLQDWD